MCASLLAGSVVTRVARLVFVGDVGAATADSVAYSLIDQIDRTTDHGGNRSWGPDHGVRVLESLTLTP